MGAAAAAGVVLAAAAAFEQPAAACTSREEAILRGVAGYVARGDDAAAAAAWSPLADAATPLCPAVRLAWLATRGWLLARALAAVGGDVTQLAPVQETLRSLEDLRGGASQSLEVEYAQTAIRAATAAAQDERGELALLLDHARDLAERLASRGGRAEWPRSFNLLAGELWFEVDRYEESYAAYERALRADGSSAARVGAARSLIRMGRIAEGCAAYRAARDASAPLLAAAAGDVVRCR